jgi:hypothetical protein
LGDAFRTGWRVEEKRCNPLRIGTGKKAANITSIGVTVKEKLRRKLIICIHLLNPLL